MKILDSKGRIFGKVNIIDFLIVLLIVLLVAVGGQLFLRKEEWITVGVYGGPGNWWWVTPPPPYWLTQAINVGDKEYGSWGKAIAEILEIRVYPSAGQNREIISASDMDFSLKVRLQVRRDKTGRIQFKRNPVQIGMPITLSTGKVMITGNVTWIEGQEEPEITEKIIEVKGYRRFPWEGEAIKIGDKMTDGNEVIAEVLDKGAELAEMVVTTDVGNVLLRREPTRRDITVKFKIKGVEKNGEFIFREEQIVKPGKRIFIQTPSYDFSEFYYVSKVY